MNLAMKQKHTHRHREQTHCYQEERMRGEKVGVWDRQIQTTTRKQINNKVLLHVA